MVRTTQDSDVIAEMRLDRAQRQTFSLETEISAKFASPEDTILDGQNSVERAARIIVG